MDGLWSGTIIYEWSEEANNYGLVNYSASATGTTTVTPTPLQDYSNLSNQWKTLSPSGVKKDDYSPSVPTPVCPSSTAGGWPIDPSVGPPTIAGLEISTVKRVTTLPPTGTETTATGTNTSGSGTAASDSADAAGKSSGSSTDNDSSRGGTTAGGLTTTTKIVIGVVVPLVVILR